MHDAHLAHALSQADGHQALLAAWRSADGAGRAEASEAIARVLGSPRWEHLLYEWSFGHGRAVLLWQVETLAGLSLDRVVERLDARLGDDGRGPVKRDGWVEATARPRSPRNRVVRLARERLGIHLVVHVVKTVSVRQEDERHVVEQTVPVELMIPEQRPAMVRTFATVTMARAALRTFLTWLTGNELPAGPSLREHVTPFTFSEATCATLERRLHLTQAGVRGDDPRGINGKYEINGRESGEQLLPLDLTAPEVAMHVSAPRDERTFNYRFVHPDGFVESGRVKFKIRYRPTHLEFPIRTSRSAMEWLVNELLEAVDRERGGSPGPRRARPGLAALERGRTAGGSPR